MKITELQIDQFGVWRNLVLPLDENGLTVVYGPNETGKSTLREFVRGVLFGYPPESLNKLPPQGGAPGGAVWISTPGALQAVSRRMVHGVEQVDIVGGESLAEPETRLEDLRQGISPALWDGVFCLGIEDFQRLGVLDSERVSEHIYQSALEPAGQRLFSAAAKFRSEFHGEHRSALERDIVSLLERRRAMAHQLNQIDARRPVELSRESCDISQTIERAERGLADCQRDRRTMMLRQRAWAPVQKLRAIRAELAELPDVAGFPENGLAQLERLDRRSARLVARGRSLVARLRTIAAESGQRAVAAEQAGMLRGLLAQKPQFEEAARQLELARRREAALQLEVNELRGELGSEWSDDAVRALDVSVEASGALEVAGAAFDAARIRYKRLCRARHRLEARYHELNELVAAGMQGLPGGTIEAAFDAARSRLDAAPRATELRAREELLARRLDELRRQPRQTTGPALPAWLSAVMAVFFFTGIVLAGWGFLVGATASALSGLLYGLLGLTFGGLAWGLKTQYEHDQSQLAGKIAGDQSALERDLDAVRREVERLPAVAAAGQDQAGAEARAAAAEVSRLSDLSNSERELQLLARRRRRLKQALIHCRKTLDSSRADWFERLRAVGLSAAGDPAIALPGWRALSEMARRLAALDEAAAARQSLEQFNLALQSGAGEIASQLPWPSASTSPPGSPFEYWRQLLAESMASRQQRREQRQEMKQLRRVVRRLRRRLQSLSVRRSALWLKAGAATRAEFALRGAAVTRQIELQRRQAETQADLDRLGLEFPDMTVTFGGLENIAADFGSNSVEELHQQSLQFEQELDSARDRFTAVTAELDSLARDSTSAELRFEAQCLDQQLQRSLRSWAAQQFAGEAIEAQAAEFERNHQPETLSAASSILSRLTCGRHRRIWTPLTARRLMIEDDTGVSRPCEDLSRGTREQLFLAVRLAVVERLAQQGLVLPVLLDDVIVNFDQSRSEAAVDELMDFASRGHQLLFLTCHLHLAQMFKSRGIEPRWLSSPRESERIAG